MGLFKDSINLDSQYAFLLNLGFEYNLYGKEDYIKTINHNEIEVLWITVNPQESKVYLYNEWDCGGELWSRKYDIPQDVLENESDFMDWLDEKIGDV